MAAAHFDVLAISARLTVVGLSPAADDDFIVGYEIPRISAIHRAVTTFRPSGPIAVLDVGFLNGRVPYVLRLLDREGRISVTSTERDEDTVRNVMPAAERLLPGHRVVTLDLTDAPRPGAPRYDAVILGEVLEHISAEHLPAVFRVVAGLLEDDGVLIVTTPNLHGLVYRVRHALGADFLHDPLAHPQIGLPHVNLLSARLLTDLGKAAGLSPAAVEFHDFTSGPRARRSRAVALLQHVRSRTLSRALPQTGDDLLVVLRRGGPTPAPSAVFGRLDVSIRDSLAAARAAAGLR